jgi:hypothetical protein
MQNLKQPWGILFLYSVFVVVSASLVLGGMLSSPSEAERAVAFGLSTPRLAIALSMLVAVILFTWLAFQAFTNQKWAGRFMERWFRGEKLSRWIGWLSGISLGLGWIGCSLPAYRLGAWSAHWERTQPLMLFILLTSLATLTIFIMLQIRNADVTPLKMGLPLFIWSALLLGILFVSRFGVASVDYFWYGAGVPILVSQVIIAILGGIVFVYFETRWPLKRLDIFVCIAIYLVTAVLWSQTPLKQSFFFTGPSAPDGTLFPFADAATFDTASQFALIGEKLRLYNSVFFERPLYLSFLAYLHTLFGQNYETVMSAQAGILAILPVLTFLIGRSLEFRAVGFAAAIATMLRGINSIAASNLIDLASPKVMLTDFPAALGIAIIVLLTMEWLKYPSRRWHYSLWIGGAIGFTLMLRTNSLILLALIPFYALSCFTTRWKPWLLSSLLILLGTISITLPWELRNQSLGGMMYGPIVTKFQDVIRTRYEFPPEFNNSLPQGQNATWMVLKNTQPVLSLYQEDMTLQDHPSCDTLFCFSANHFLHNIVTSFLILPTSPVMDDLRYLVKERFPYWQIDWDGSLTGPAVFFLALNLYFTATGVALAWKEQGLSGLTPLAIFIFYAISNSLARTSGGRYIVPIDWIIILYYLLGVFWVITWAANMMGRPWKLVPAPAALYGSTTVTRDMYFSKAFGVLLTLFLFGAVLPLTEKLYLPRYQNIEPLKKLLDNQALVEQTGLKFQEVETFLQNPGSTILVGRALYPRFYKMNQGEYQGVFFPFHTLGFPRTAFKLIGPAGESSVVLSGNQPANISHTNDVLVLGCNGTNYFDALAVIVLDDDGVVYTRDPEVPLQCPFAEPVCNNNSVCQ